jgi:putative SbcD/Mre11-related phosphoesterase
MKFFDLLLHPLGIVRLGDTVVAADLHLGFETFSVDLIRVQSKHLYNSLYAVWSTVGFSRIVLNGDVKHSFGKQERDELREVGRFIKRVKDLADVVIVKGNHDNYIENVVSRLDVEVKQWMELDGWLITHGHKLCERDVEKGVIIGHEHPSVKIKDRVGVTFSFRTFILTRWSHLPLVVLPALNPYVYGSDVLSSHSFLSPFLQPDNVNNATLVLTDGQSLYEFDKMRLQTFLSERRY